MSRRKIAAVVQPERISSAEAADRLNKWLKTSWPMLDTNAKLATFFTRMGILPDYLGKEATLAIYIGRVRQGSEEPNGRCPKRIAMRILVWAGISENELPLFHYTDQPSETTPGGPMEDVLAQSGTKRSWEARMEIAEMSAEEIQGLRLLEAIDPYRKAMRDSKGIIAPLLKRLIPPDKAAVLVENQINLVNALMRMMRKKFPRAAKLIPQPVDDEE